MSGRGVTLTPHPFLVPWSRKNIAIPLLPLWDVRPEQSLNACTRVTVPFLPSCPSQFNNPLCPPFYCTSVVSCLDLKKVRQSPLAFQSRIAPPPNNSFNEFAQRFLFQLRLPSVVLQTLLMWISAKFCQRYNCPGSPTSYFTFLAHFPFIKFFHCYS
jgi:hypothetical protein